MRELQLFLPLILALLGIAALHGVRFWWSVRREKKRDREHAGVLAALASSVGGTATDPGAVAWSAELRGPMANEVGGLANRIRQRSRPRFDLALDFRRGPWQVRVSEASMRQAVQPGRVERVYEHRIEVATVRLAPLKFMRRLHTDFLGRPLNKRRIAARENGWVTQIPVTAEREQAKWMKVNLPEELDREFVVFTTDLSSAPRVLNPRSIEWLLSQKESPVLLVRAFLPLTFESGLVYLTMADRIDPETLVPAVDAIIGLLDRIPVATPRHPATTA